MAAKESPYVRAKVVLRNSGEYALYASSLRVKSLVITRVTLYGDPVLS